MIGQLNHMTLPHVAYSFDELLTFKFELIYLGSSVVAILSESLGYFLFELLPLTHQGAIHHSGQ